MFAASVTQVTATAVPVITDYNDVVQQIYVGYFGRPADPDGLAFYEEKFLTAGAPTTVAGIAQTYNSNVTVKSIIDSFSNSAESAALYPGNNNTFILAIYKNLFNRAADNVGLAYWVAKVDAGLLTRSNAAISIIAGTQGTDTAIITNKIKVANNFTKSLDTPIKTAAYSGLVANVGVRAMLGTVSDTTDVVAFQSTVSATISGLAGMQPNAAPEGYIAVSAGYFTTFAVKSDGSLWAWGHNNSGQLGVGNTTDLYIPTQIGKEFSNVSAGFNHTVALKTDGSLWAWGMNFTGAVGDGTQFDRVRPVQIGTGFTEIATGDMRSFALKSDGTLWAWGDNDFKFGDGTTSNSLLPKKIGSGYMKISAQINSVAALKNDGSLWVWGLHNEGAVNYNIATKISAGPYVALSISSTHGHAIKADGSLWAWGGNNWGQLGDSTHINIQLPKQIGAGYSSVATGERFSIGLKTDGTLWAWGSSDNGQFGNGTTGGSETPMQVGKGYKTISAARDHAMGIKQDGSLWRWGGNEYGVLGDGTTLRSLVAENGVPIEPDDASNYSVVTEQLFCTSTGFLAPIDHIQGPCAAQSRSLRLYVQCGRSFGSNLVANTSAVEVYQLQSNLTQCLATNSKGIYKTTYENQLVINNRLLAEAEAVLAATRACPSGYQKGIASTTCYQPSTGKSCVPGENCPQPSIPVSLTGPAACAVAPYEGGLDDPQADSFYRIAQFDACLHRVTGLSTYDAEGRANCALGDSIPRQPGVIWKSKYCPFPY